MNGAAHANALNGDSLPPHDEADEAGALGCVLLADPGRAEQLLDELTIDHFYDLRHKTVYSALNYLRLDHKPLNTVVLDQWLRNQDQEEDAGGLLYVAALADKALSVENFPTFFEALKADAIRRAAIRDATEISRLAMDRRISGPVLTDAARRMLEAYSSTAGGLPPIVDAAAFTATPQVQPPELVHGILHQGSKLVLGGGSKSFKTWTLLDLALSVAHGKPWLGCETSPGPVLYINFEIQDYAWQKRIAIVAGAKQIELKPGAIMLWNLRGKAADFQTFLPKVISQTRKMGFVLIVLDPVYKLYGRTDENKATDVAALLNGIEGLAVETKAAVAFGAHFSKGNQAGKEAIDRISGSGVFARDPDSILLFTRHEVEDAFGVECILRNFAPVPAFAVRWQFPLMIRDDNLDPARLKQAGGRKRVHSPESVLELLGEQSLTSKEFSELAKSEAGIANSTFYELLKELRKSNRIIQNKLTRTWQKSCKTNSENSENSEN